jgi:hypothetical protein
MNRTRPWGEDPGGDEWIETGAAWEEPAREALPLCGEVDRLLPAYDPIDAALAPTAGGNAETVEPDSRTTAAQRRAQVLQTLPSMPQDKEAGLLTENVEGHTL